MKKITVETFSSNQKVQETLREIKENGRCLTICNHELAEDFRRWVLNTSGEDPDERQTVEVQVVPGGRPEDDLLVFWPEDDSDEGKPEDDDSDDDGEDIEVEVTSHAKPSQPAQATQTPQPQRKPWRIADHADGLADEMRYELGDDFDERCRQDLDDGWTPVCEIATDRQAPWIGPTQYRGDYNGNPSLALLRPGSKKGCIGWAKELVRMPEEFTDAEVEAAIDSISRYAEAVIDTIGRSRDAAGAQ